jgi:hypothetical protein
MTIATPTIRIYERLRLYQPLGLLFQPEANMPPGATAEMPACLLCESQSNLPPAKMGWLRGDDETRLFLVCADCDGDDIERRIIEKVMETAAETV